MNDHYTVLNKFLIIQAKYQDVCTTYSAGNLLTNSRRQSWYSYRCAFNQHGVIGERWDPTVEYSSNLKKFKAEIIFVFNSLLEIKTELNSSFKTA